MSKVIITRGKFNGINACADERGVIAAAAMDQRGSLQKSIAKARGANGACSDAELTSFKTAITKVLTKHSSAILMDPNRLACPATKSAECRRVAGLRKNWLRCHCKRPLTGFVAGLERAAPETCWCRCDQDFVVLQPIRRRADQHDQVCLHRTHWRSVRPMTCRSSWSQFTTKTAWTMPNLPRRSRML